MSKNFWQRKNREIEKLVDRRGWVSLQAAAAKGWEPAAPVSEKKEDERLQAIMHKLSGPLRLVMVDVLEGYTLQQAYARSGINRCPTFKQHCRRAAGQTGLQIPLFEFEEAT